ncbi:MAG TPA: hypothetical protein VGI85_05355 [Chthoniobacterales bacterium]
MSPENELATALRQRLVLIGDPESRRDQEQHLAKLQAISERIVAIASQLSRPVDPQLAHFLARGSYDKALALLEANASF